MRIQLGKTETYLDVDLIYTIESKAVKEETFYVQNELLNKYDLTVDIFVSFLMQNLDKESPYYLDCLELWGSNLSAQTRTNINDTQDTGIPNVKRIITDIKQIDLTKNTKEQSNE